MDLTAKLLALAAAVSWDGGHGVLQALRRILDEEAPFDAGEVALSRAPGFERFALADDAALFVGEDLLVRVVASEAPIRIDDIQEVGFVPLTRARMAERGLRSCLALPLNGSGGPEGAIVVAREHGWAFAGASIHTLGPVAAMTGLCLARAVALTALKRDLEVARVHWQGQEENLRKGLSGLESESQAQKHAIERANAERSASAREAQLTEERLTVAHAESGRIAGEAERWRAAAERSATELGEAQALARGRAAELQQARELAGSRTTELQEAQELARSRAAELHQARELAGRTAADLEQARELAESRAAELQQARELAGSRAAELASAIQKLAELDRKLGERESATAPLAPPAPPKRRRRSRDAPEPSSGADGGLPVVSKADGLPGVSKADGLPGVSKADGEPGPSGV